MSPEEVDAVRIQALLGHMLEKHPDWSPPSGKPLSFVQLSDLHRREHKKGERK